MTESKSATVAFSPAAAAFGELIGSAQATAGALAGQLATACFRGASEGHSCLEATPYFPASESASAALAELFEGNPLVITATRPGQAIDPCLLVIFQDRLYLKKSWLMENALIGHLLKRSNALPIPEHADVSRRLALCCLDKPLSILSGGPGHGKDHRHFRRPGALDFGVS